MLCESSKLGVLISTFKNSSPIKGNKDIKFVLSDNNIDQVTIIRYT